MLELALRLSLIGVGLALSAFVPGADIVPSAGCAAVLASLSVFGFLLDRRKLRNHQASTILVCIEIAALASWMASAGELSRFGVLALAPLLWAVARDGVEPIVIAPIAAASLIAANAFLGRLEMFSPGLLVPAGIVLVLGLMLELRPKANAAPQPTDYPIREAPLTLAGDDYLEIRESYRVLRQRHRELERVRENDQFIVRLFNLRNLPPESMYPALAELIADLTGSDGAAVLEVAESVEAMVVRGATTDFPDEFSQRAFSFDSRQEPREIRLRLDSAIRVAPASDRRDFANVLLQHEDMILGMICVAQSDVESLNVCREKAEEIAPKIVSFLMEEAIRRKLTIELNHTEMLYRLASDATEGEAGCARAIKLIAQAIGADAITLVALGPDGEETVAAEGAHLALLDSLKFQQGPGLTAWLRAGCPEVAMFDARSDDRCVPEAPIRRRIGSYCQLALRRNGKVIGYIAASTHRAGGLDVPQVETLRLAAGEVTKILAGIVTTQSATGLLPAADFRRQMGIDPGSLVVLEVLHREQLSLSHAKLEIAASLRKLQARLLSMLPDGASMCRRSPEEFLVFLASRSESEASEWANDAVAHASLIGITRIDQKGKTPIAIRSRIAEIVPNTVSESAGFVTGDANV